MQAEEVDQLLVGGRKGLRQPCGQCKGREQLHQVLVRAAHPKRQARVRGPVFSGIWKEENANSAKFEDSGDL